MFFSFFFFICYSILCDCGISPLQKSAFPIVLRACCVSMYFFCLFKKPIFLCNTFTYLDCVCTPLPLNKRCSNQLQSFESMEFFVPYSTLTICATLFRFVFVCSVERAKWKSFFLSEKVNLLLSSSNLVDISITQKRMHLEEICKNVYLERCFHLFVRFMRRRFCCWTFFIRKNVPLFTQITQGCESLCVGD